MKKHLVLLQLFFLFSVIIKGQNLDFNAPDTVCVGQQINIINNSSGWQTYKWNYCKGEPSQIVVGVNLGNPSSSFVRPDFLQVVKDGSNYVGLVSNDRDPNIGYVSRVNFGTSIENIPTVENLGDFGGKLNKPTNLKLIKEGNNWYCFYLNAGLLTSDYRLVRLDFGNSLLNTPTLTDFGNIGGFLSYPLEIDIIKNGGNFIGFITNLNNTLQRLEFGASLTSTPSIFNLGNIGNLSRPTNFKFINSIGKWYMFLVNDNNNSITRLDFGNSLNNTPIGKNLGNPQGKLNRPLDIIPFYECGDFSALVANGTNNQILRIDFVDGIESLNLNATNLGNLGGLSYPGAFSNLLYDNGTKYAFVANTTGNTLSRLKFSPCFPLGQPSSNQFNPPSFSIDDTTRFLIQLIVDEGLPSESQICKQVIVIKGPSINLGNDTTYCGDFTRVLSTGIANTLWSTGQIGSSITVTDSGTYWASITLPCGILNDSIIISTSLFTQNINGLLCPGDSIILRNDSVIYSAGTYTILKKNQGKCDSIFVYNIQNSNGFSINLGNDTLLCEGDVLILKVENNTDFQIVWSNLFEGNSVSIEETGVYFVIVNTSCGIFTDTIIVTFENCDCNIYVPNAFSPNEDKRNDLFYPKTECQIENEVFRVFNRWGEKVFESTDVNIGWDGIFKGKNSPLDTYVWTLEYNVVGNTTTKFMKGMVNLIK